MRSKDQLNPDEEDETREIASVRIHVERAIERVKNCNILKQILPNVRRYWQNLESLLFTSQFEGATSCVVIICNFGQQG